MVKAKETVGRMKLRRYAGAVYDNDEVLAMVAAIHDGWWSGGPRTEKFEEEFSLYLGVKHAIACNSGSSADLLAVSALELERGDEVITPAATFPTTVNPAILIGLSPVFVDVELDTYDVDPVLVEEAVGPKTRALVIPHMLGNPCNMEALKAICARHGLKLIEDCCDALGAKYGGSCVASFGDMATFSFYPAHHMTTGEGGMVVTNDDNLAEKLRGYRDWGRMCNCRPCDEVVRRSEGYLCPKRTHFRLPDGTPYDRRYAYGYIGFNLKMTEVQAAMGLAQLKKLEGFIEARKRNYATLRHKLEGVQHFILPRVYSGADPSWFAFPLTVRDGAPFTREQVTHYLESRGIQTRPLFAGNILCQPAYHARNLKVVGRLTNSDKIMKDTFFVGVYPGLDTEDMEVIGDTIRDVDNGRARLPRK